MGRDFEPGDRVMVIYTRPNPSPPPTWEFEMTTCKGTIVNKVTNGYLVTLDGAKQQRANVCKRQVSELPLLDRLAEV